MAENENIEKVYEAIEIAKSSGKIKKGSNEVTKAIERGTAKLVAIAKDVSPPEITMHIPLLCKEKGILCFEVTNKQELGASAGLSVPTTAIAIINEGDAKKHLAELKADSQEKSKAEEKKEEKTETKEEKEESKEEKAVKEEPKAEEKKEENPKSE